MTEIRNLYYASVEDEDKCDQLLNYMTKLNPSDATMLGYKASAEALKSKHVWAPMKKLDWLKKSMATFDGAVSKEPRNAEIRFLRFSVQHFVPKFLGQSENLEEDRVAIVDNLWETPALKADETLRNNIIDFLIETERCSEAEINSLLALKD